MQKKDIMAAIYERAAAASATIALPDAEDERIRAALPIIETKGLAKTLLIKSDYFENLSQSEQDCLTETIVEARAARGKPIATEDARRLLETDTKYVAAAMVRARSMDCFANPAFAMRYDSRSGSCYRR